MSSIKVVFICFNESPLKLIKNAFYFMLKAVFVLKIISFLSSLFGYVEKRLDKKVKVNFKMYDVTELITITIITIHMLSKISRSKCKQTMEFCQQIEYNMRNIFLEESFQIVVEKLVPDPFVKNQH